MGLRATSVKKYEVEYGDVQGFNYDPDTLENIINEYCDDVYTGGEYSSVNDIWEIEKGEFSNMVDELRGMSEEEFNDKMENDWAGKTALAEHPDYTQENIVRILDGFLKDTPESENYVRIGWL